jgi:hypothetical protein
MAVQMNYLVIQWLWKYAKPVVIALAINVLDLVCLVTMIGPLLVLVMLLVGGRWKWLMTPDVDLPGDLTVPAVKDVYDRYGSFLCSWYWLGFRNRWHGLDFVFAVRLPMAWNQSQMGYQEQGDLWWARIPFTIDGRRFQLKAGYRLNVVGGIPYGVPCCGPTKA